MPVAACLAALLLAASADPTIAWTPGRVVLGETSRLTLRVRVPGAGADSPPPRLRALEGVLRDPERAAPDEWTATLELPAGGPPLHAIVSAVVEAPGEPARVAFAAIPLRGRALVPVETEPGAGVTVELAGETLGPLRADRRGRLEVALEVPPGVTTARVRASGPGGRTERRVALPGSPSGRIALEAVPDGPGRLRLEIFVAGGARPGEVVLEADGARVSAPRPVPGHADRLTAMAEGPPGRVRVRAWLRGAELLRDEVAVRIAAVPAPGREGGAAAGVLGAPAGAPRPTWLEAAAPTPLPAPTTALAAGYRSQPGRTGGAEVALALSWSLGRGGGLVLGVSGLLFAHGAGVPAGESSLEAGLAPEGLLLLEIPGATLLAAAGPTVELACAFTTASADECAAALGVSARLALAWQLPGRSWLTAEGGLREILAGGGRARQAGLAGGLGAALGVRWPWP